MTPTGALPTGQSPGGKEVQVARDNRNHALFAGVSLPLAWITAPLYLGRAISSLPWGREASPDPPLLSPRPGLCCRARSPSHLWARQAPSCSGLCPCWDLLPFARPVAAHALLSSQPGAHPARRSSQADAPHVHPGPHVTDVSPAALITRGGWLTSLCLSLRFLSALSSVWLVPPTGRGPLVCVFTRLLLMAGCMDQALCKYVLAE